MQYACEVSSCRSHSVELPSDLSSLVLKKLQSRFNSNPGARNALQNLLALGLVSKAWKSAIFKYSGNLLIEPVRQDDLLKVVKTLPDIQELRVESNSAQHFPHLSAFTGLTRLDYQAIRYGRENEEIDIDLLPPSLIDLTLSNCRINSASLNKLESFKLTSLKLRQIENTASEQYRLLQGLPNLQVSLPMGCCISMTIIFCILSLFMPCTYLTATCYGHCIAFGKDTAA